MIKMFRTTGSINNITLFAQMKYMNRRFIIQTLGMSLIILLVPFFINKSLAMLPSASIGVHTSLFEPIHGSYPQAAGEDIANPMAAILSAAMLVESLGMHEAAKAIRFAVQHVLEKGIGTPELQPAITYGCTQIGDLVALLVADPKEEILVKTEGISQRVSTII